MVVKYISSLPACQLRGSIRGMKTTLAAFLVLLAAALAAPAAEDARPRPEFPDLVLVDLNGQAQKVSDFRGTVTVLNFWATWCGPCRMELPELEKLYNELGGQGFVVLAVNVEGGRAPVGQFMQRMGVSLPVFLVDPQTQAELGISAIPFTILLDREGKVVRVYPGYSKAAMADLRTQAGLLLAEKREPAG